MTLLALRLVLALVFVIAGLAKLFDLAGSRKSMIDFGVPPALALPSGILLPLAEFAAGVALCTHSVAWNGAVAALGLLLLFIIGVSINLALGHRPDCHCFGRLYSTPIGWKTLLRNAVLAVFSLILIWKGKANPGPAVWNWIASLAPLGLFVLIVMVVGISLVAMRAWSATRNLKQDGQMGKSRGLPLGSDAPQFRLADLRGTEYKLEDFLGAGKPLLLIFVEPGCDSCHTLLSKAANWQNSYGDKIGLVIVSRGGMEIDLANESRHGVQRVLLQKDREVSESYKVAKIPAAVLVEPDGKIASSLATGQEAIQALVRMTILPPPVKIGETAPSLSLPAIEGGAVGLEDFRGKRMMILFWNPACNFCQEMLADFKAWERSDQMAAPAILVVSNGDIEATRAQGFRSPVVMDHDFLFGYVFGSAGTPSAVLLDEEMKIASEVAAGAERVFALAGARANLAIDE